MSRIEVVFGGILVLAVIAAASFVMLQNGLALPQLGGGDARGGDGYRGAIAMPLDEGEEPAVFTGDVETDLCTCYETGFTRAETHQSVQSVAYRAGFQSCRSQLGADGGNAWTEGWSNGADNRLSQRSCRLFLQRMAEAG